MLLIFPLLCNRCGVLRFTCQLLTVLQSQDAHSGASFEQRLRAAGCRPTALSFPRVPSVDNPGNLGHSCTIVSRLAGVIARARGVMSSISIIKSMYYWVDVYSSVQVSLSSLHSSLLPYPSMMSRGC